MHVKISRLCNYALVIQDFITGEPIDMVVNRRQEITEPYFAAIPAAERNRSLFSQRKNAQMLSVPLPPERYEVKTGIIRGPYEKKNR